MAGKMLPLIMAGKSDVKKKIILPSSQPFSNQAASHPRGACPDGYLGAYCRGAAFAGAEWKGLQALQSALDFGRWIKVPAIMLKKLVIASRRRWSGAGGTEKQQRRMQMGMAKVEKQPDGSLRAVTP